MTKLSDIEGIGNKYAEQLKACGVATQQQLLEQGSTPAARKKLAEQSGISPKLILKWINRADLARIRGIGGEYADLLENAGIDTVPELAQRKPENLHKKLLEINEEKKLVRSTPNGSMVANWVEQAKGLDRAIHY
ncbi:MAG: ferredoxin [Halioglobus sp.]|nr:ferredoxin [Halioglobus sp.]|tara:strand:- start:2172 stop:2576 length:405 start_codon:yes stop_codon:yes gene_type:complete